MNRWLPLAIVAVLGLAACSNKEGVAAPGVPSATAIPTSSTGKIVQLQQAGGYTYAEVETGGRKVWIAGGHIDAKVGDTVQWGESALMHNFNAKSLGRVFDQILFVGSWGLAGGTMAEVPQHGTEPASHPPMAGHPPTDQAAPAGAPTAATANKGEVKTVKTAAGYTYVEVVQGAGTLWIAAPETEVKVGDTVSWSGGMEMQNFNAKSLNRVFDKIVFASSVTVVR